MHDHHKSPKDNSKLNFLEKKVAFLISQLENFIHRQTTTALLLTGGSFLALVLANLPWKNPIDTITEVKLGFLANNSHFTLSIGEWISSGLMTVFFFIIGLEIKREILAGELQDFRYIIFIIIATIGGMVIPGILYSLINYAGEGQSGWAIPMATDTAFAIGVLAILAKRVSNSISIFLAALAIFDDIFSIAIIAIFYTEHLHYAALFKSLIPLGLLIFSNRMGLTNGWIYIIFGVILWYFIHASGIHGTLAGLIVAITIPAKTYLSQGELVNEVRNLLFKFEKKIKIQNSMLSSEGQHSLTEEMHDTVNACSTPLQRWESFFIIPICIVLPIFALFNAGIELSEKAVMQAFNSSVTWGIIIGLVIGKPVGIILFSLLGSWLKIGKVPKEMSSREIIGIGLLSGIGFTMSLFITSFAFVAHPELVKFAKFGILFASLISASIALTWLYCIPQAK